MRKEFRRSRWSPVRLDKPEDYSRYRATPLAFVIEQLGFIPDTHQAKIFDPSIKRGLLCCTRQFGKSTSLAALAVHRAVTDPGSLTLILAPVRAQSSEFLHKVSTFLQKQKIPVKKHPDHAFSLVLPNGSRLIALANAENHVRCFTASLVIIEEAARVDDGAIAAIRPALAISGGTLWMISTPNGRRGAFYRAWTSTHDWFRLRVTAAECPRISEPFLNRESRELGERFVQQDYFCNFLDPDGYVFDTRLIEAAIADLTPTAQSGFVIGLDLGKQRDHTAIVIVDAGTLAVQHIERLKLGTSFTEVANRLRTLAVAYSNCSLVMDSSGLGAPVYDMLRHAGLNCPIRPIVITAGDSASPTHVPKKELIMNLQRMFERHQLCLPRTLGNLDLLLEELRAMRVIPTHTGRLRYESAKGFHDDLVLALSLAVWRG